MEELKTPQYIGEEGDMAVNCKTKRGAWLKFRKQTRDDVGDYEANEIEIDDIREGYVHLPTDEEIELGEVEDDCEYFISRKENENKVWVLSY